jgi:hypothetical protein
LNLLPPGPKSGMHPLHLTLRNSECGMVNAESITPHSAFRTPHSIGREGFEPSPNRLKVCDADRYTSDPSKCGMLIARCELMTPHFTLRIPHLNGGRDRTRTCIAAAYLFSRQAEYQFSNSSKTSLPGLGSNQDLLSQSQPSYH